VSQCIIDFQCAALCCSALHVCCSILQCVAKSCRLYAHYCVYDIYKHVERVINFQCAAVCCSKFRVRVATCCSVLQRVAICSNEM